MGRRRRWLRFRSARTGRFVSREEAEDNRDTTVGETVEPDDDTDDDGD